MIKWNFERVEENIILVWLEEEYGRRYYRVRIEPGEGYASLAEVKEIADHIIATQEALEKARGDLKLAVIRLEILTGRMCGCNEEAEDAGRKPTHELIEEAEAFVREGREALATAEEVLDSGAN